MSEKLAGSQNYNGLSIKVVLLINSQAMLDYFKEAKALKDVFYDILAL
jgi:hypothetical protein